MPRYLLGGWQVSQGLAIPFAKFPQNRITNQASISTVTQRTAQYTHTKMWRVRDGRPRRTSREEKRLVIASTFTPPSVVTGPHGDLTGRGEALQEGIP
jgi:hypothetical protein